MQTCINIIFYGSVYHGNGLITLKIYHYTFILVHTL